MHLGLKSSCHPFPEHFYRTAICRQLLGHPRGTHPSEKRLAQIHLSNTEERILLTHPRPHTHARNTDLLPRPLQLRKKRAHLPGPVHPSGCLKPGKNHSIVVLMESTVGR